MDIHELCSPPCGVVCWGCGNAYIYIYICMYVCKHVCVCKYIYIYMHVYIYICMYLFLCICLYEYVCYVGRLKGNMYLVNGRLVVRIAAKT